MGAIFFHMFNYNLDRKKRLKLHLQWEEISKIANN